LFFHHAGKTSPIPPPAGGLSAAIVAVTRRGKEYHVVAAVEGHELKTPEMEHRPGLERLLETAHLELDGKLFVNTQQAPTWRANCWRFETGGSLGRRVKCRRVPQPRWVGARRSAKGEKRQPERERERWKSCGLRVCPAPRSGALAVGGYKRPLCFPCCCFRDLGLVNQGHGHESHSGARAACGMRCVPVMATRPKLRGNLSIKTCSQYNNEI
jgi:hypothetical protein